MKGNRRIRVTLGGWIIGVTLLCVAAGAVTAIFQATNYEGRDKKKARASLRAFLGEMCIANLRHIDEVMAQAPGSHEWQQGIDTIPPLGSNGVGYVLRPTTLCWAVVGAPAPLDGDGPWIPAELTNCSCPLATGTNNTFWNSYDIGNASTPPTCRIRPKEHVLE